MSKSIEEINTSIIAEFECPICMEYMHPPILLCAEGHSICKKCMTLITKCPICSRGKTGKRNYTLESLREKLIFPCRYKTNKCSFSDLGCKIGEHEAYCTFRPYACPFKYINRCNWTGHRLILYDHCKKVHGECVKEFGEDDEYVVFTTPSIDTNDVNSKQLHIVKYDGELFCVGTSFSTPSFYLNWYVYHVNLNDCNGSRYSYEIRFNRGDDDIVLKMNCHLFDDERSLYSHKWYLSCHYHQLFGFMENDEIKYKFKISKIVDENPIDITYNTSIDGETLNFCRIF